MASSSQPCNFVKHAQPLLDALGSEAVLLDAAGKIVAVNQPWARFGDLFGLELPNHGLGCDYFAYSENALTSEGWILLRSRFAALVAGALPEIRFPYPCPGAGATRWFEFYAAPIRGLDEPLFLIEHRRLSEKEWSADDSRNFDPRNRPTRFSALTDGTHPLPPRAGPEDVERALADLHAMEHSLVENLAGLHDILESLDDVVWVMDLASGRIEYINGACLRVTGYRRDRFLSETQLWYQLILPEDRAETFGLFLEGLHSESNQESEFRFRCACGKIKWLRARYAQITDEDGRRSLRCVAQDLTQEKRHAEENRLISQQLAQAARMDALAKLAGGVAHDFNNLLTPIVIICDFLLKGNEVESPVREDLQEVLEAAQRGTALTKQLLSFFRSETPEERLFTADEQLRSMETTLRRLIRENILLDFRTEAPRARLLIDPSFVDQALLNLVANASEALPRGGSIRIASQVVFLTPEFLAARGATVDPGDYYLLSVTDNGVGIPRQLHGKIFEPFFTTRDNGRGTGLGLATVARVAREARGLVEVESEEGAGSTFRVYLPVADQNGSEEAGRIEHGDLPRGTERILVADDDAAVLYSVRAVLRGLGYHTLSALEGAEALELLQTSPPDFFDLLLSDVVMPGMNGVELARNARKEFPSLGIVLMSGHLGQAETGETFEATSIEFPLVRKPFDVRQLATVVRDALDARQPIHEPSPSI